MIGQVREGGGPGFAFISGADCRQYFVRAKDFPVDSIGRKWLNPGEQVSFDIQTPPSGKKSPVAVNLKVLSPRESESIDLSTYSEIGHVHEIGPFKDWAFVTRPCGGWAYLHYRDVAQCMNPRPTFYIGQPWQYGVRPNEKSPLAAWVCTNAIEFTYDNSESEISANETPE